MTPASPAPWWRAIEEYTGCIHGSGAKKGIHVFYVPLLMVLQDFVKILSKSLNTASYRDKCILIIVWKGISMEEKHSWLRHYTYALALGVLFLVIIGMARNFSPGSGMPTGYVVSEPSQEQEPIVPASNTLDYKIVVSNCQVTPERLYAKVGDKIILSFTAYDTSKRLYKLEFPGQDLQLKAKDPEIVRAEFSVEKKGKFEYRVSYPCDALGFDAKGYLIVS